MANNWEFQIGPYAAVSSHYAELCDELTNQGVSELELRVMARLIRGEIMVSDLWIWSNARATVRTIATALISYLPAEQLAALQGKGQHG